MTDPNDRQNSGKNSTLTGTHKIRQLDEVKGFCCSATITKNDNKIPLLRVCETWHPDYLVKLQPFHANLENG